MEAGLARKATRKESIWNQHQAWFKTVLHPSKAVCEMFAKSALYWHRTYGIHVAGIVIYPGDEESGRQASGFFVGSDIVKALIDTQYKDLEAVQAGGKNINFLPPAALVANASLLHNSKSNSDRNRMVAPMVISKAVTEAGHVLKTSNSRWMTMLDVLYSTRLCIHDWPAGVLPPGTDFDLKVLSTSQLHALVGPYLRIHLGEMYEAELGQDEDEDDSDVEKGKMAKQKGKSKKSNEHRRMKVQLQDLTSYTGDMFEIPLVIDTDGVILCHLKDSEKFIKDLPSHITCKQIGKMIHAETPTSDASFLYMWYGSTCQLGGSMLSPWGSMLSPWGSALSPWGYTLSPWGSVLKPRGYALKPRGFVLHHWGFVLHFWGSTLQPICP
ncbi:hypothetical protein BDR04DRAFT_1123310 [Suillus decipiens]|nr:hypothetical protein BDR04DRAFT_1123310 [Suillus decipiens]